ncbi:carotenoid cleavage dioxygenase [Actinomadura cremea]|nr:carotenoid cleavage dioxygenase [Actinomadura cremea]
MAAEAQGTDPRTAPAAAPAHRPDAPLPVAGGLPPGLRGCFLQAETHPLAPGAGGEILAGPHLLSGIVLDGGTARWLRCAPPVGRGRPLGPVPALAPVLWAGAREADPDGPGTVAFARPVRDPASGRWHTVATYPGLGHAEHLVTAPDGTVVHAEPFPLDGAPLVHAVGLTARYLVVFDLPVTHSRAAALVGERLPYAWREGRPARVGFLPRAGGAPVTWVPVDPCYVFDVVDARDDGTHVVLDVVGARRAFDGAGPSPARLRRWRFDPAAGTAEILRTSAPVTGAVAVPAAEPGPGAHRLVATEPGGTVVLHDPALGTSGRTSLGRGWRPGAPVFVPGPETGGWILVVAHHAASGRCELRVLDTSGRPAAAVRLPVRLAAGRAVRAAAVPDADALAGYVARAAT